MLPGLVSGSLRVRQNKYFRRFRSSIMTGLSLGLLTRENRGSYRV